MIRTARFTAGDEGALHFHGTGPLNFPREGRWIDDLLEDDDIPDEVVNSGLIEIAIRGMMNRK